jgi:hypothetical protein
LSAADLPGARRIAMMPPEKYDQRAHAASAAARTATSHETAIGAGRCHRPSEVDFSMEPVDSVWDIAL